MSQSSDSQWVEHTLKRVNADQEAWVRQRLLELVEIVEQISMMRIGGRFPGAATSMVRGALEGAVNGAAIEIIRLLGMKPVFVNLREEV